MSSLAYIPSFSVIFFSFSRFIPIMQIRYILIKDHIYIFFSATAKPN
jgi:hypothetical protein